MIRKIFGTVMLFVLAVIFGHAQNKQFWNKDLLFKTPSYRVISTDSITTLYYKGINYRGKETEVYAIYCTPGMIFQNKELDKNLPAVVCIHGGGGTASRELIVRWAKKGYAAIAMDWRGNGPDKMHLVNGGPEQTPLSVQLHENENIKDSWTYQAVSQIILAHSLIRNFKEVNPDKTVITGLSWGGFLTSLVCGIDNRFKAAIPIYGCGFIYEHDYWKKSYLKMNDKLYQQWINNFDPSNYLNKTSVPFLFVAGTNDFFYPVAIWQKSADLVEKKQQLLKLRMPHSSKASFDTEEVYAFANAYLSDSIALPKFKSVTLEGLDLRAKVMPESKVIKAELLFTESDSTNWFKREWNTIELDVKDNFIQTRLPADYKACCINITNNHGYVASSDVFLNRTQRVTFRPSEIPASDPVITNPGIGWHSGYSWGPGANSYDVAARILWRDLEPVRNKYDFTKIEELLNNAQSRGGRALIRIRAVATSGIGIPDYMVDLMPKGFWKDWLFNKKPETFAYVPDWNDPDFIERAKALLYAVGKKYNNDPRLGILDIGMYGRWGEWHCAGIKYPTESGAQEITEENIRVIIDMHIQAFPNKRLVMMTDNIYGLKYALQKSDKIGWRRDSYGTPWFQDPERMNIVENRWQTAPVVAEPIGEFSPGAIGFCNKMAQQSKEFHVATIHGINTFKKDLKYSDEEINTVIQAGKNSGFRFVISSITLPQKISRGGNFEVSANWKNEGVTPAYEKWQVVYQFRNKKNGKVIWEGISSIDLEKLLPAGNDLKNITDTFLLPLGVEKGLYDLVVTVKDKETDYRKPMALAMRNRLEDGSYKLGEVEVLPYSNVHLNRK